MEIVLDVNWLLGLAGVATAIGAYLTLKVRIHKFRILLDIVDDALVDDKISEAEFRAIYAAVKELLRP